VRSRWIRSSISRFDGSEGLNRSGGSEKGKGELLTFGSGGAQAGAADEAHVRDRKGREGEDAQAELPSSVGAGILDLYWIPDPKGSVPRTVKVYDGKL